MEQKNSIRKDTKNYTLADIRAEIEEDVDILWELGYKEVRWLNSVSSNTAETI